MPHKGDLTNNSNEAEILQQPITKPDFTLSNNQQPLIRTSIPDKCLNCKECKNCCIQDTSKMDINNVFKEVLQEISSQKNMEDIINLIYNLYMTTEKVNQLKNNNSYNAIKEGKISLTKVEKMQLGSKHIKSSLNDLLSNLQNYHKNVYLLTKVLKETIKEILLVESNNLSNNIAENVDDISEIITLIRMEIQGKVSHIDKVMESLYKIKKTIEGVVYDNQTSDFKIDFTEHLRALLKASKQYAKEYKQDFGEYSAFEFNVAGYIPESERDYDI